jgi:hypothetical protein
MRLQGNNGPHGGQSHSGTSKYDILTLAIIDGLTRAQLQKRGLEELNGTRKRATSTTVQRYARHCSQ